MCTFNETGVLSIYHPNTKKNRHLEINARYILLYDMLNISYLFRINMTYTKYTK